ncbi:MAG: hypothetical protein ACRERV_16220 [Methylococcales bacterium]
MAVSVAWISAAALLASNNTIAAPGKRLDRNALRGFSMPEVYQTRCFQRIVLTAHEHFHYTKISDSGNEKYRISGLDRAIPKRGHSEQVDS